MNKIERYLKLRSDTRSALPVSWMPCKNRNDMIHVGEMGWLNCRPLNEVSPKEIPSLIKWLQDLITEVPND